MAPNPSRTEGSVQSPLQPTKPDTEKEHGRCRSGSVGAAEKKFCMGTQGQEMWDKCSKNHPPHTWPCLLKALTKENGTSLPTRGYWQQMKWENYQNGPPGGAWECKWWNGHTWPADTEVGGLRGDDMVLHLKESHIWNGEEGPGPVRRNVAKTFCCHYSPKM